MPVRPAHLASAGLIAAMLATPPATRAAPVLSWDDPKGGWDLSTRVSTGREGFNVAFKGPDGSEQTIPAKIDWSAAASHHFELSYTAATGAMSFRLDVSGNGAFEKTEMAEQVFKDFAGWGFRLVTVTAPGGVNHMAWLRDLTINGVLFGDIVDGKEKGASVSLIDSDGSFRDILIAGDLMIQGNGRSDGRPGLTLRFGDAVPLSIPVASNDQVPEPDSVVLLGLGVAGLAAIGRYRRRARPAGLA